MSDVTVLVAVCLCLGAAVGLVRFMTYSRPPFLLAFPALTIGLYAPVWGRGLLRGSSVGPFAGTVLAACTVVGSLYASVRVASARTEEASAAFVYGMSVAMAGVFGFLWLMGVAWWALLSPALIVAVVVALTGVDRARTDHTETAETPTPPEPSLFDRVFRFAAVPGLVCMIEVYTIAGGVVAGGALGTVALTLLGGIALYGALG